MKSENEIQKYIYDWLVGLKIGKVFQDKKPYDDTTEQRDQRGYIVYAFEDGIEDMSAFYHGVCVVSLGCRDKAHFVADQTTLDKMAQKFKAQFEHNNNDIHLLNADFIGLFADDMGNHEYHYVFDVFAEKT